MSVYISHFVHDALFGEGIMHIGYRKSHSNVAAVICERDSGHILGLCGRWGWLFHFGGGFGVARSTTKDLHLDMANPLFAGSIGHSKGSKHIVLPVSL